MIGSSGPGSGVVESPHTGEETGMNPIRTPLALGAFALAASLAAAPSVAEPSIGQAAPAFEAADENGELHRLADYAGKVVVLEWTNPDCPYVDRHYKADTMEKLSARYQGEEVVWLAVNSTHYNEPEDTRKWKAAQGFDYPTLQDAKGAVGRSYGARTTPHMFVIDPEGRLAYRGAIDDDPRGRKDMPVNFVDGALTSVKAGRAADPSDTKPYGCSVKYSKN